MQIIRGIPVKLYCIDGRTEIVENVLIGEPAVSDSAVGNSKIMTYTLAVPKGDLHDWTDKKIEFFGRKFRTVGKEIQGIEENIPLCWHKKITAEELIENGSCTFYDSKDFSRHIYTEILISDNRNFVRDKVGELKNGSLDVLLYAINNSDFTWFPKVGDYIVPHECAFEFETSSEQKVSESMLKFRKEYSDFSIVNSVEKRISCRLPDIIISAR